MSISPPRPKGPPLNALRAFEAAARLGGFKQAADELSVTPGAISQHIKALEAWAGAELFERRTQGVVLTPLATNILPDFSLAFDALSKATRRLRTKAAHKTINIAALPNVALLWLTPRLPAIRSELMDLELSVTALETPPNLQREMFDLSLFLDTPANHSNIVIIQQDVIIPVCSPALAKKLHRPEDIMKELLLYDAMWESDWDQWARCCFGETFTPESKHKFSLYSMAVEEAKNGAGILIGHKALIEMELLSGDLVAPIDLPVTTDKALYMEFADEIPLREELAGLIERLKRVKSE